MKRDRTHDRTMKEDQTTGERGNKWGQGHRLISCITEVVRTLRGKEEGEKREMKTDVTRFVPSGEKVPKE